MSNPWSIMIGDCITRMAELPAGHFHCCVTSPPYWGLRDYRVDGQIGLEDSPQAWCNRLVEVFRGVWRVLRDDGTLWLNVGDAYAGSWGAQSRGSFTPGTLDGASDEVTSLSARQILAHPKESGTGSLKRTPGCKSKDLIGLAWMLAFALRADGWYLRSDIIWSKPNPMPESVTDRPTKAHEYLFLLSKIERYYFDADAIRETATTADRPGDRRSYSGGSSSSYDIDAGHKAMTGPFAGLPLNPAGRNRRTVWEIPIQPYSEAHFATYPEKLVEPCILAGSPKGGRVLDPFNGSGTTGAVAVKLGREYVGCELNPDYVAMAHRRIGAAMNPATFRDMSRQDDSPLFAKEYA